jgi:hypothetical protein
MWCQVECFRQFPFEGGFYAFTKQLVETLLTTPYRYTAFEFGQDPLAERIHQARMVPVSRWTKSERG